MDKRLRAGFAAAAIVASACGGPASSPSPSAPASAPPPVSASPSAAAAQEFDVSVDGKTEAFNSAFLAYFPNELSVHPGDTIGFTLVDTGEPHTVTLGTLADAGMEAADAATDPSTPIPELEKLPSLLPDGPGDANQTAANPCFVETGEPPANERCADTPQPEFTGKQAFYNSGWLGSEDVFSVTLAPDIEPGTYRFLCLLHVPLMAGKINVVEAGSEVKAPAEVATDGQAQLDAIAAKLQPAVDQANAASADTAVAGTGSPDAPAGLADIFGPADISIAPGGSVTWTIIGPHTISFNAPEDARGVRLEAPDGSVHINEKAVVPASSPGQPAPDPSAPPPDPNAPPTLVDAGKWDGTGYRSSGVFVSFPPALFAYKTTFTKPGTFTYECLIHPDMEGTVKVG